MQAYWTLVRRELGAHFISWTAYVVIGGVLLMVGLNFVNLLQALNTEPVLAPVTELFYDTFAFWLILLMAVPVITMRTFALEKYSGTFETLMTTPVSDRQVVLAKFTGALLLYAITWAPLLGCLLIVRHYAGDPSVLDAGTMASMFLGILLLGSLFTSLGCLASALTRSQIIAAMICLAGGLCLFLLSYLNYALPSRVGWQSQVLGHLCSVDHMKDFARGIVDTRQVFFYLSLSATFLYLTLKVVESRRWK